MKTLVLTLVAGLALFGILACCHGQEQPLATPTVQTAHVPDVEGFRLPAPPAVPAPALPPLEQSVMSWISYGAAVLGAMLITWLHTVLGQLKEKLAQQGNQLFHLALNSPAPGNAPGTQAPAAAPAPVPTIKANGVNALLLFLGMAAAAIGLSGCGTPAGTAVANALESPANQQIISFAVQAGVNSILASTGKKLDPTQEQALSTAASSVASSVATGVIYAGAEALRTKQATTQASAPGPLTAALTSQGGMPASTAPTVAGAVTTLAATGVPGNAANEGVAATLDAVAAAKQ